MRVGLAVAVLLWVLFVYLRFVQVFLFWWVGE